MKISKSVECAVILRLALDDLAVLCYCCRNFPRFQVLLGRTQSLYLIDCHFLSQRNEFAARSDADRLTRMIQFSVCLRAASELSGTSKLTRDRGGVNEVFLR